MATIVARTRRDGSIGYTARIRLHKSGKLVHKENKTFSTKTAAEKWGKKREVELENPAELLAAQIGDVSLGSLIRWYIDTFGQISKCQRSKQSALEFLEKHQIGKANALDLTVGLLVDLVRSR